MMRTLLTFFAAALVVAALPAATKPAAKGAKKAAVVKTAAKPAKRAAAKPAAKTAPLQTAHRRDPYVGAISADAATGKVLFEDAADREAYPASVTKLMTALLVLEDVKTNKYSLTTQVTATPEVNYSESSWVGIKVGESMSVNDLMMALMVQSANDAAIVLGVNSAGSLQAFVDRMNARAQELGMTHTHYTNPSGLPPGGHRRVRYPWKDFNRTTARDQLKLAMAIVKLPEIFRYTSTKVTHVTGGGGQSIPMLNHNRILRMDKFHLHEPAGVVVDGLKTGYIDAGGSSIVLTATCKGHRAIVVVLGSASSDIREAQARRLMTDALGALTW